MTAVVIHARTMLCPRNLALAALVWLCALTQTAQAWGAVGHEIVATIAQTQLHPDVRAHLCSILPVAQTSYQSHYPRLGQGEPAHRHCHLAPLAAWADRVRGQYPWASHLHYVNPLNDNPPQHCTYGEQGWQDHGTGNVLGALVNFTGQLASPEGYSSFERDLALRFVTHFMGDIHQPLHLTGRARGGNDVVVHYNGRYARLHTVWDTLLINDHIRDLYNYTTPLPSLRIESALQGRRYDPYVRWILAEGLGQASRQGTPEPWWKEEADDWTACPDRAPEQARSKAHWLRTIAPHSAGVAQRVYATIFRSTSSEASVTAAVRPDIIDDTDLPLCPYAWTKPMHGLVCSYAFAEPVPAGDKRHTGPLPELNVPEYTGRINDEKIIQRQLARAGIRLAAVLNTLLLPEAQRLAASTESQSVDVGLHTFTTVPRHIKSKHPKHGGHHTGGDGGSKSAIIGLVKVTASSIAEVILLSSVGYVLARQGVLDKRTQTKINKVNVSVFTPALLFSKVAFSLDPGRLAELVVVPLGFILITVVSGLAAMLLSWVARLPRSHRNFSVACAITPNSNSLPVALMQSLVVTVPQLHWEEQGEPEDTVNGMLGRALTYLVLFSTLGMFVRWSLVSQLLSTMEDEEEAVTDEEQVTGVPASEPRVGQLIDVDEVQAQGTSETPQKPVVTPRINIRRSTQDGGGSESLQRHNRHAPPAWLRSFPNTPGGSDSGSIDDDDGSLSPTQRRRRSMALTVKSLYQVWILAPYKAVTRFMTMPLYAALLSLVVALLPPVQRILSQIEPLVGALETAGACSIPLTMVVLGAYFHEETPAQKPSAPEQVNQTANEDSRDATLVNDTPPKRSPMPFERASGQNGSVQDTATPLLTSTTESDNARPLSDPRERKRKSIETRAIIVAVASRMLLTPILLLPVLAWYAISTQYNVVDDPVFICCACLLIGSPPAVTLAQITSQSAKGSNSSFERLISKTIFISYAIAATPTTIVLVMTALLIAQNDH